MTKSERDEIKDLILKYGSFIRRCGYVISYPDIIDILDLFTEREVENEDKKELEEESQKQQQQMDEGSEQAASKADIGI